MLRTGIAAHRAADTLQQLTYYYALLAESLAEAGRTDEAVTTLNQAAEVSRTTQEHFWSAEILRLRGVLDEDAGEDSLNSALQVARQQSAKTFELRAATSLARLWQRQGRREEARAMLSELLAWFNEGSPTADLLDAKDLLKGM